MARGDFYLAVALQGVASSGRTCEILFIAGRTTTKKERERRGGTTKIEGRREGSGGGRKREKKKKDRYLSTVTEESHVLSRFVASMQMHTRRSIVRDTLVLAFRKMDFTREGGGEGGRLFEIYYIRGKRERERDQ